MDSLPVRKKNRLQSYDYSTPGYYFITFCTEDHACILGHVTPPSELEQGRMILNETGKIAEQVLSSIPDYYPGALVDNLVIMPNHVHLILVLEYTGKPCPDVSRIIQQAKSVITKRLGKRIWQIHFHDHVIRGEQDYKEIWEYMENNPAKWSLDRYYRE